MPTEDITELVCSTFPVDVALAVPVQARAAYPLVVKQNSGALIRLYAPGAVGDFGWASAEELVHSLRTQIVPLVVAQRMKWAKEIVLHQLSDPSVKHSSRGYRATDTPVREPCHTFALGTDNS